MTHSKKIFFLFTHIILFFSLFILFGNCFVYAIDDFKTICGTTYRVSEDLKASVTQEISLVNLKPDLYVSQYSLLLGGDQIVNVAGWDRLGPLTIKVEKKGDQTEILLNFNEKVVGKEQTLSFIVKYEINNFVKKEGKIWHVSLPKLANENQPESYKLELTIPSSFGLLAYASPNPQAIKKINNLTTYVFDKSDLAERGASLEFGDYQIFDFNLNYHLANDGEAPTIQQISLPPDTEYQKIFLKEITPPPLNVKVDEDGNWLAEYSLKRKEILDIKVTGKAEVFSSPTNHFFVPSSDLKAYVEPQKFWEAGDEQIKKKAADLKSPKNIYDFVEKTLNYNYDLISAKKKRSGALKALNDPQNSLCLEFTDLFVALTRAAGIPAREIEGFAYTNSPKLRPLSSTQDILHAWSEYYDQESNLWRMIDPTWGKTSGGFDYFNNFDMSHLTFVIHGQSSSLPLSPGAYKSPDLASKDVLVEFGSNLYTEPAFVKTDFNLPPTNLLEKQISGEVKISNTGPNALYNVPLEILHADLLSAKLSAKIIPVLPPFGWTKVSFSLNNPHYLFKKMPAEKISLLINGEEIEQKLTSKNYLRMNDIFLLFLLIIIFIIIFLILLRRLKKGKQVIKESDMINK